MKRLLPLLIFVFAASAYSQTATIISVNANLRGTASTTGRVMATLPADSQVDVLLQRGAWYLVQSPEYVGWTHGSTIRLDTAVAPFTLKATPIAPTPDVYTPKGSYIRGPRGGCYYINSRGNKTYVDRSLCS